MDIDKRMQEVLGSDEVDFGDRKLFELG